MKCRIFLPMLILLALTLSTGNASNAEAGVFRRLCRHRPVCCKPVKRTSPRYRVTNSRISSPRMPWERGGHLGKWPPYYQD
jgi:hypothetical protein